MTILNWEVTIILYDSTLVVHIMIMKPNPNIKYLDLKNLLEIITEKSNYYWMQDRNTASWSLLLFQKLMWNKNNNVDNKYISCMVNIPLWSHINWAFSSGTNINVEYFWKVSYPHLQSPGLVLSLMLWQRWIINPINPIN